MARNIISHSPVTKENILSVLSAQIAIEPEKTEKPKVSVTVSLAPDGSLRLELPMGDDGALRQVELSPGHELETIRRVLHSRQNVIARIGSTGAPTNHQAKHWQKHQIFPSPTCPFCKAEAEEAAAFRASQGATARHSEYKYQSPRGDGTVVVRTLAPRGKARKTAKKLSVNTSGCNF